ncbi:MAG: restriction endonuclease subunit S, partial [Senegalia sp. (in: firmicutes)]|uniref:restriction endonuclease subunit S n=1 Tax=Senegalia sp. (in: firmicutes) TaxID=1924098 RepID=UPI003F9A7FCB
MTRKMKDSGVEWIGEIPEDWEVVRLKSILRERNEKNDPIKTKNLLSLTAGQGVIPFTEREGGGNKAKGDYSKYKVARPNDLVINSMNIISGSVGLSRYKGCVSPVYYTLTKRNEKDDIRYYSYIFRTKELQNFLLGYGNGIMMKESEKSGKLNTIRLRIPIGNLNMIELPICHQAQQKAIANFLDKKTLEIDNIVSKTKKVIKEYKKYKQSLITETVTKGLDKNVEMKDIGIEWIGEIPGHWSFTKLKYLVNCNEQTL